MKPFIPSKFAEIIFALVIGYFGVMHFTNTGGLAGAVPSFMPADAKIWVYITGAGHILAALAILTGMMKTVACYLLAAMLLIFVFTIHLKPAMDGNAGMLLKDTAMAMCAILIGNRSTSS